MNKLTELEELHKTHMSILSDLCKEWSKQLGTVMTSQILLGLSSSPVDIKKLELIINKLKKLTEQHE